MWKSRIAAFTLDSHGYTRLLMASFIESISQCVAWDGYLKIDQSGETNINSSLPPVEQHRFAASEETSDVIKQQDRANYEVENRRTEDY